MDKRTRKMFASVFANKKSKHLNQYLKKEQKLSLYFQGLSKIICSYKIN